MDYFKILTILVIIILIYQIYLLNKRFSKIEGFADVPVQSLTGIDDANAINTLAQIAKNLMAGGVTVPGAMNLSNASNKKITLANDTDNYFRIKDDAGAQLLAIGQGGDIFTKGNGLSISGNDLTVKGALTVNGVSSKVVGVWHTSTDGKPRTHYAANSHSYYRTADAHVWRNKDDKDIMVLDTNGTLMVQGRNILAELNDLRAGVNNSIPNNQRVRLRNRAGGCNMFDAYGIRDCGSDETLGWIVKT